MATRHVRGAKAGLSITLLVLASTTMVGAGATAQGCAPARVAVLDTGVDAAHPEFATGQVVAWRDFVNWRVTPYDDNWHGTATASLVGGRTLGARPGVDLLVGKVLDAGGSGALSTIASGVRWAVEEGADVISMSLGTLIPYPGALSGLDEAIAQAREAGVLVIVAAGNMYVQPSELEAPSHSPHALVVGAASRNGGPATFSNRDPEILAWGVNVLVAAPGGTYRTSSGTSFATPLVAGWAADVYEAACEAHVPRAQAPGRVEHALKATARDSLYPYAIEGHGFVDAETAATAAARVSDPTLAARLDNEVANEASDLARRAWTL